MADIGGTYRLREPLGGAWDVAEISGVFDAGDVIGELVVLQPLSGFDSPIVVDETDLDQPLGYDRIGGPEDSETQPWQTSVSELSA